MKPLAAQTIKDTCEQRIHVLIAAAGQSLRFGSKTPKQYSMLAGKPVLHHAVECFTGLSGLASITVIIDPAHADFYRQAVHGLSLSPPVHGGAARADSIRNAINSLKGALPGDIILVHDAARPLTDRQDILNLLAAMQDHDAASLGVPVFDTMRRSGPDNEAGDIISRENLWALQTPQAFKYEILKSAHDAMTGLFTDDTGIVSATGTPVKIVQGARTNIKITLPEDFTVAKKLFQIHYETRTGFGYDVHAFSDDPKRPLMLCGVSIDHPCGLAGHSDADVALHALTDALLGTIGAGDIGLHFPPSNPAFKDMDSALFLQKTCVDVRTKGGTIVNCDITVICEAPKIGPWRDAMQKRTAEILNIDPARINIKATTTEGLGFTGRGEGIAAQAVATVKFPA